MSETWTIWCGYNVMKKAPNKGCKCNVCLLYRRVEELERQLAESINDRVNLTKRCNNIAVELAENKTYINTWLEKIEALEAGND